jgi:hypothetical protein
MRVLSEKKSVCTHIKVLYEKDENYYEDIKKRKEDGWIAVTKPNFYDERMEIVMKQSSNGTVITFVNYSDI